MIALVVWLILVFFSVTRGLEKNWIKQLIALTAPVRVTPTEEYFTTYYHRIDKYSEDSNFAPKSLREKLQSSQSDPYDSSYDPELPTSFPSPLRGPDGQLIDLVKEAFAAIEADESLIASDFELAYSNIRLRMIRRGASGMGWRERAVNQAAYVASFSEENPRIEDAMLEPNVEDLSNVLGMLEMSDRAQVGDDSAYLERVGADTLHERLERFFHAVTITALQGPPSGWRVPRDLLPQQANWQVCALLNGGHLDRILIPSQNGEAKVWTQDLVAAGQEAERAQLIIENGVPVIRRADGREQGIIGGVPLLIPHEQLLPARLQQASLENIASVDNLEFEVQLPIQGSEIKGLVDYRSFSIGKAEQRANFADVASPDWFYVNSDGKPRLPAEGDYGEGVLVSKSFRDNGVRLGDRGYLSFFSGTTSGVNEQRIPVYVAGFYDPGIVSVAGRFITLSHATASMIRSAQTQTEDPSTTGINVWCGDPARAESVKARIQKELQRRGISDYWKVETYRDYEFSRDIIQQLQSEKNLFSVISVIIILVACSNIITMLILLVNDKKVEIGILRSMGASSRNIALIFGSCGVVMGALGSILGTFSAWLTLRNLQGLIDLMGRLQGHVAFNEAFYGKMLPNELSFEALTLVWVATVALSLLAGLVPAIKATLLKPSAILRAEG